MKTLVLSGVVLAMAFSLSEAADNAQVAHMVYFKLKKSTPETKKQLVDLCEKHLSGHDGTVYFSAGVLADDLKREVNVRDFDVALHLVFKDKACHDKYQEHPRHLQFIKEGKDNWANVRVFDSYIHGSPKSK